MALSAIFPRLQQSVCVPICTHAQNCESGRILKLSLDSDWGLFNILHHTTLILHLSISPTSYLGLPATSLIVSISTRPFILCVSALFAYICIIFISPEVFRNTFLKTLFKSSLRQFSCSSLESFPHHLCRHIFLKDKCSWQMQTESKHKSHIIHVCSMAISKSLLAISFNSLWHKIKLLIIIITLISISIFSILPCKKNCVLSYSTVSDCENTSKQQSSNA